MKLNFFHFIFLFSHLSLHATVDDSPIETSIRRVRPAERDSFYAQLNRTSRNVHGRIARDALEPIFVRIASGDIAAITSISDDDFNAFAATYMVARNIFKNSFRTVLMFSLDSSNAEQPKHDMAANLPVNKMDDMLLWAWSIRWGQSDDPRNRMIKQMSFVKFKAITEGDTRKLIPTAQIRPPKSLVVSALSKFREPQVELPETHYYQEQTSAGVRYRVFSITCDTSGRPLDHNLLPDHPIFGSVFLGDVEVSAGTWALEDTREPNWRTTPRDRGFYHYGTPQIRNGAIFRKDGTLLEKNGIVIVPQRPFPHCYLVLEYYKNPDFNQMCLKEYAVITKQSDDIPGIAYFINAFGGFNTIDKQGIGFIECVGHPAGKRAGAEPSSSTPRISIAQARILLPYLYLLATPRSEQAEEDQATDPTQTIAAIKLLETVLVDAEADDSDAELIPTESAAATTIASTAPKRTESKTESKEEVLSKQQLREIKLKEEKASKKLRKLEGIREYFRKKAAELKQYSLTQTQEILERLYTALSSHGIHATGESRTKGDHHMFSIAADETGHSASVGLVLRGQKGFQSGTVKRIIDDHMDTAIQLLGLMLRK